MDKEALLKRRLPEDDVEVPGVGTFRVRGLSRAQALAANKLDDDEAREVHWLACGIVAPELTAEEIRQWREVATHAEVEAVAGRIAELSGVGDTSVKDATKSTGDESGTEL